MRNGESLLMRVITGTAKGRKLTAPQGLDTRPTSDMVKEAMFSAIQFDVEDAVVLDLFAGSGQLGIEALSRGAEEAFFVDSSSDAIDVIRKNITAVGFTDKARIYAKDVFSFVAGAGRRFNIIFLDPPYEHGIPDKIMPLLEEILAENGFVICEHEMKLKMPESYGRLSLKKTYKFGKISFSLYVG